MNECWRCEGVVLYQRCHEFTHYCVMEYKNLKQKMLPSPHSLHYWHFFSMTMKIFILPRWKSFSGHVFHSVLTLLSSCGGFCRDELSKLPIKDQSIQGGRPPGVKQDRCENLSWTCTLNAKKGQSSILKVLEDILSTRILYICWIKSRVYSFLQSFI